MVDALWSQGTGATFTAAEDRAVIKAVLTNGVARGLVISAASGRQVNVTDGTAIVPDAAGTGSYVAYTTATTTLTITASTTQTIYIVVDDPGAGGTTVQALSSPPTDPYLAIGTATASATAITAVSNARAAAVPHSMAAGGPKEPFPFAGGVMTGTLQAPRLYITGTFDANGASPAYVNMPLGARLGSVNHYGRCYSRAALVATGQNIANDTWTRVNLNQVFQNQSMYGSTPFSASTQRFTCPISGVYAVNGQVKFSDPTGVNVGNRRAGIARRNAAGGLVWLLTDTRGAEGHNNATVSGDLDCAAGDTLELMVAHQQGATLGIEEGSYSSGFVTQATFRLAMAF